MTQSQPWLGKKWIDVVFILLPPFLCLLCIFLFPTVFQQQDGLSDVWWVAIILLIDVAHVYTTLYRTYLDPIAYQQHKTKLMLIPLLAFVAGVLLYNAAPLLFWRFLAYIAVFHFVRQQYGFMRLYSRNESSTIFFRLLDTVTIYTVTIYPIIFWHLSADRNFNWFVQGDFINVAAKKYVLDFFTALFTIITSVYVVKEIVVTIQLKFFNGLKNAVVLGTGLSWYFGIVYFNGDMAFTLLNVVSHGVPYMALIWVYSQKSIQKRGNTSKIMKVVFGKFGLVLFLAVVFLLAFIEEGLWDITLWKEHTTVFAIFNWSDVQLSKNVLNIIVPLLALPQITHYIIDGFIWRIKQVKVD
jgi:hypothetical protein